MSKVTLRYIAEKTGVHPSTVSRALDPARASLVHPGTRELVQTVADSLGYRPNALASGLRRGRTNTFGVVVVDLGNPFVAPVIRGIENNLESRGFMALIAETQDEPARLGRALDHLRSRKVDAIITTAARAGDEAVLRRVGRTIPTVLAVRHLAGSGLPAVTHDDTLGGRLAAEHLISVGCRRLAQLPGPVAISSFVDRGAGFGAAADRHGTPVLPAGDHGARPDIPEGERLMELLLAAGDEPPDGVFAHNDQMAIGALAALRRRGLRCPEDVRLIGYNDSPLTAYTAPPLSTIRLPGYELGRIAGEVAVSLIEDPTRTVPPLSLPPVLIPRASSTGLPAPQ
ncbi:MAG: LacI family transcriptional regulator [Mycobacteriales bacterium]|jgi:LacI family transcriptional regulator